MFAALTFVALGFFDPTPALTVTWEGPTDCGSSRELEQQLRELLPETPEPVLVAASVTPVVDGFSVALAIRVGNDSFVRSLEAGTCQELLDAAALVAAVAAGSDGSRTPAQPSRCPDVPAPTCPQPAPPEPPSRLPQPVPIAIEPPPPGKMGSRASLGAEGGLSTQVLSPLTWTIGGRVQWLFGPWRVALGAHHDFGRRVIVDEWVETRIHLTRGSLLGCWAHRAGRWEFPLCLGTSLGTVVAQPLVGIREPERRHLFWGAADVSIGATLVLDADVALFARADLLVPFVRPGLALAGGGERHVTYRAPPAGASFALGMAFRVP